MHIGLIVPGFSAHDEDWCIPALLTLVRTLSRRHAVTVLTLRYPHRRGSYRVAGAAVHALGGAEGAGAARVPLLVRGLAKLRQIHRAHPFDVLHAFWADEPGLLAVVAGRLLGVPQVVSLGGGELERRTELGYGHGLSRTARQMVRLSLRGATLVTVGSESLRQRVAAHVEEGRLRRQPLGVDRTLFTPDGPAQPLADPALLHVGSLVPIKGQERLLQALATLHERGVVAHLHLVGEGPRRASLAAQAGGLGIAPFVHWYGSVPHHELPAFYRGATLFLLSSHVESQGMVVLEAGACGLPTVGTAVGVLPELGAAARTVPPSDEGSALAAAVVGLLTSRDERQRMSEAVQARVAAAYALDRTVAGWEVVYETRNEKR